MRHNSSSKGAPARLDMLLQALFRLEVVPAAVATSKQLTAHEVDGCCLFNPEVVCEKMRARAKHENRIPFPSGGKGGHLVMDLLGRNANRMPKNSVDLARLERGLRTHKSSSGNNVLFQFYAEVGSGNPEVAHKNPLR